MTVLKFGGSSVANAEKIRKVAEIVVERRKNEEIALVFSAMKGITDLLIAAAKTAEAGEKNYTSTVREIEKRHKEVIFSLFPAETEQSPLIQWLIDTFTELRQLLHGVELLKECSLRSLDLIMSFGERMNCRIIGDYIRTLGEESKYIDGTKLITTNESHGAAVVDFSESYRRIEGLLANESRIPVITGFIAASSKGVLTTLGRNGSDYTASIVAAGLKADYLEIWTDVDGVMSADPRFVKEAFVVPEISTQEAMELSYFGAEVLHPYTMIPVIERKIPIRIKNTLSPHAPGTLISHSPSPSNRMITGIASIENVALINVEGSGMVGMPGIASRIFSALAVAGVNIIMISQASSEHSICIVCRQEQAKAALDGLNSELAYELEAKKISRFELIENLEIVAVIGENMRGTPGISGRLFSALGENKVNVLAIAQGSSERNISFVVEWKDREKVLNVVHKAFFDSVEVNSSRLGDENHAL